jgi:Abnormal spindle-like microcephaly-assoc'd, ASPM-SPD-2-Hydin/Cep192 domain 4/Beta-propeller repeat
MELRSPRLSSSYRTTYVSVIILCAISIQTALGSSEFSSSGRLLAAGALQPAPSAPIPAAKSSGPQPDSAGNLRRAQQSGAAPVRPVQLQLWPYGTAPLAAVTRTGIVRNYGSLPLSFEPNQGQTDPRVRFLSRGQGYTLFLTGDQAVLALRKNSRQPAAEGRKSRPRAKDSVLAMQLIGANPNPTAAGIDALPGKSNYFIGNDPGKWRTNVPNFARVKFHGIYPGVDLVYYGNQGGQLEYDFVVAPGADPRAIRLDVAAVGEPSRVHRRGPVEIATNGDLVIRIEGGEVRFRKPVVYQPDQNSPSNNSSPVTRHSSLVEGHYKLSRRNQVSFEVGSYDHRRPLVIDPTLGYSTYLGGATALDFDAGNGIALDSAGDAYITGQTFSSDFPQASNTCNACGTGGSDAFVAKLDPLGTVLLYSTYLGGSGDGSGSGDAASGIAVDASGNAYVTGLTTSADFPTQNAFQASLKGTQNAFVTRLSSDGSSLAYSTYLGGTGSLGDQGNGIAVDASGDAVVVGSTSSSDFPTVNPYQSANNGFGMGGTNAFVAQINTSLSGSSSLAYSTYLGGTVNGFGESVGDAATAVAVDTSGNAYVGGSASSTDFPVKNALQGVNNAAANAGFNSFIAKLNPSAGGSLSLVYSTYLGGSQSDSVLGIAVDGSGDAYVTGSAFSVDFPTTANAFQQVNNAAGSSGSNAFVTELAPDASSLLYSTYLGGSTNDFGTGIALDSSGNAYITGTATSADYPQMDVVTPVCAPSVSNPCAIASEVGVGGSTLTFSTLLGGTSAFSGQGGQSIVLDSAGNVYVTGETDAPDFPTTTGAFQTTLASNAQNAFVTKFASAGAGVSLSSNSLDFGTAELHVTSPPQTVTLTNNGAASLDITSIAIVGTNAADFALTTPSGACPASGGTVDSGESCTINVTFTPSVSAPESASVSVTDNASNSPQSISLSGTGASSAPTAVLSPTSLTFPTQVVTTTSSAQTVTLSNTGNAALSITTIAATGDFGLTGPSGACASGGTVDPNATCTINVTFAPTTSGTRNGTVSVMDNAGGSPQTVSLTGTGLLAPVVSLSPTTLTFASQATGTTSPAQTVTLTNTGSATLNISSITVTGTNSGDFAATNTCGSSVSAGAKCTISITFTPTVTGTRTAAVTITDNNDGTNNSTQTVSLTGTGTTPTPGVSLSPTSLTFSSQLVGSTSAVQTVTLSNNGSASLSITSIAASGDFAQTNTCPASLAAGNPAPSCTISVTFTPTAAGTRTGTVTVTDSASGSPQTVSLTGTGTSGAVVSLSPTSLTFSSQALGTTSAAQTVTLSNTGNATLSLTSITASGDFAETNTCPASLAAGNPAPSCTISVTFKPTASGTRTGTLTITDNASGSPQTVSLTGTGTTAPAVSFTPASLTFSGQETGTTSAAQTVTLTNTGSATLTVSSITASGDFAETNTCGTSVNAAASCTISVTFTPSITGTRSGTVTVTDNASGSPQTVSLTGTGTTVPVVSLSPASVTFNDQAVGTTSTAQTVTLTNTGNASLSVTGITASGDFAETNTCGTSVSAGSLCTISVTFKPSATGTRTGTVSVTDNASGSPQTVSLTGSGVAAAPGASLSTPSLTFSSSQPVGQTSSAQTVTLTNNGNAALSITSIAVTGTNSGDFAETNTCGTSVNVDSNCTISVTFKPTAIGSRAGTVSITDNATGSPQAVSLSGGGVGAAVSLSPSQLTFDAQLAGTASAAQTVTVMNSGNQSLSISKISTSGDFAVATSGTTCSTKAEVAAGSTCTIGVTFTPTAGGTQAGSLVLDDNAVGGTQTVTLTGTGQSFSVAASGGGVATVTPGQSASYTVTLTPQGGFNQSVTLSCAFTGLQPAGTSCSIAPTSVTPTGTAATPVAVTVATTAAALVGPRWHFQPPSQGWPRTLLLIALALMASATLLRRRRPQVLLIALLMAVVAAAACGGGGGGSLALPSSSPGPTPAGTYQLTLKATSGAGLAKTVGLTLVVQ